MGDENRKATTSLYKQYAHSWRGVTSSFWWIISNSFKQTWSTWVASNKQISNFSAMKPNQIMYSEKINEVRTQVQKQTFVSGRSALYIASQNLQILLR